MNWNQKPRRQLREKEPGIRTRAASRIRLKSFAWGNTFEENSEALIRSASSDPRLSRLAIICRIVCNGNFIVSSSMDKTIRAWHFHAELLAPQNILEDIPDEEIADNAPEITEEQDLDLIEAALLARKFSIISAKDDTIQIK